MKKVIKYLLWALVAIIIIATFVYLYLNSRPKEVVYEIVSPTEGSIDRSTVLTGKIEPRDEIAIKPQISGIIAEINVEAGDMVNEGDIIARIKVVPDEGQLSQAQSSVKQAQLAADDAKVKYDRTKLLYDKKVVSREEYENAKLALDKAQQDLAAAQDAYSIVRDGVSLSDAQGSNTLVRSTISGLILDVPVKVGTSVIQANTFNDGTTIATVANMNDLIFKGKVDETEVGMLSIGQPMTITIGAIPDFSSPATIEYISPKGTETNGTNTFEIKAAVSPGDGSQIRAGYSANAAVSLSRVADTMTIPEAVIEFEGNKTYVYVLTDSVNGQQFERREITTGISDGVNIQVKNGIDMNDRLRGRSN